MPANGINNMRIVTQVERITHWPNPQMKAKAFQIQSKAQLVWSHPHVVIVPLLVLAGLLTGGILGVQYANQSAYESNRSAVRLSCAVPRCPWP